MWGLTLHRPWDLAIAEYGKRIENRTWEPFAALVGGPPIALHAGKAWDTMGGEFVADVARQGGTPIANWTGSSPGIFATARIVGVVHSQDEATRVNAPTDQTWWWAGPLAWVLTDIRVLPERLVCGGRQRLWTVPGALADQTMRMAEAVAPR
jgi:hypothetical protein